MSITPSIFEVERPDFTWKYIYMVPIDNDDENDVNENNNNDDDGKPVADIVLLFLFTKNWCASYLLFYGVYSCQMM